MDNLMALQGRLTGHLDNIVFAGMRLLNSTVMPFATPVVNRVSIPFDFVSEKATNVARESARVISDTVVEPINRQQKNMRTAFEERFPGTSIAAELVYDAGKYAVAHTVRDAAERLNQPLGFLSFAYNPPGALGAISDAKTIMGALSGGTAMLPAEPPPAPTRAVIGHVRNAEPPKLPEGMYIHTGDFDTLRTAVNEAAQMKTTPANTAAKPASKAPVREH